MNSENYNEQVKQIYLEPIKDFEVLYQETLAVREAILEIKEIIAEKVRGLDAYIQAFESSPM